MAAPSTHITIVVLGDGGVGKSSLTLSFLAKDFSEEYDPTVEDNYTRMVNVDGMPYTVELIDTAGQEEYRGIWMDQTIQRGDGFILAYSIDSPTSFAALSGLLRTVQSVKNPLLAPFAVVATKCDLATTSRQVPAATGLAFAREHGGLFNETSAKLGVNVDQAFESLLKAVIAERERSFSRGTAGKRGKSAPSSPAHSRSGSKTLQDVSSGFDDDKENEGKTKKGKKSLQMDRRASRSIGGLGRDPQRYESDGHAGGCKCLIM